MKQVCAAREITSKKNKEYLMNLSLQVFDDIDQ